jgi:hypothetical protein
MRSPMMHRKPRPRLVQNTFTSTYVASNDFNGNMHLNHSAAVY